MGGPYLESGESIVMTTDRVSVENVMYDAILTTRRLLLIDSRHTRIEPRIIPLSTVESVRSGKAATGEPVVMLLVRSPDDSASGTTIIIFSQGPLENRKQDRDLWVQKFIELSISGREVPYQNDPVQMQKEEGIRPATRRWVAPDIIRPHTESHVTREVIPDVEIIPDDIQPPYIHASKPEPEGKRPVTISREVEENVVCESQDLSMPVPQTPVLSGAGPEPAVYSREGGPLESGIAGPSGIIPGAEILVVSQPQPDLPSPLIHSILAAARSLTTRKDLDDRAQTPPLQKKAIQKTSPLPEIPVLPPEPGPMPETTPTHIALTPLEMSGHLQYDEVPSGIRNTSLLPEISPSPAGTQSSGVPDAMDLPGEPEQTPDILPQNERESCIIIPAPVPTEITSRPPEPEEARDFPVSRDPVDSEPATRKQCSVPASIEPVLESPEKTGVGIPQSPTHGMSPMFIAGGAILCILLVLAGVFVVSMLPPDHGAATPTPVFTVTPTVIPPSTPADIHKTGVWVRIVSPGNFIGQAGNPAFLQQVSGSGEKYYKPVDSTAVVKVSVEKREYSGDELLVEIYKNGKLIGSRSVTAPMGSVELLIDPVTEKPPGLITTSPTRNISGMGNLEYY
jgi:hypothetical protein